MTDVIRITGVSMQKDDPLRLTKDEYSAFERIAWMASNAVDRAENLARSNAQKKGRQLEYESPYNAIRNFFNNDLMGEDRRNGPGVVWKDEFAELASTYAGLKQHISLVNMNKSRDFGPGGREFASVWKETTGELVKFLNKGNQHFYPEHYPVIPTPAEDIVNYPQQGFSEAMANRRVSADVRWKEIKGILESDLSLTDDQRYALTKYAEMEITFCNTIPSGRVTQLDKDTVSKLNNIKATEFEAELSKPVPALGGKSFLAFIEDKVGQHDIDRLTNEALGGAGQELMEFGPYRHSAAPRQTRTPSMAPATALPSGPVEQWKQSLGLTKDFSVAAMEEDFKPETYAGRMAQGLKNRAAQRGDNVLSVLEAFDEAVTNARGEETRIDAMSEMKEFYNDYQLNRATIPGVNPTPGR